MHYIRLRDRILETELFTENYLEKIIHHLQSKNISIAKIIIHMEVEQSEDQAVSRNLFLTARSETTESITNVE